MTRDNENDAPHRIDMEFEWDDFIRMRALVDEDDAADFLAVLYAWRDEAVTDALRQVRPIPRRLVQIEQTALRIRPTGVGTWGQAVGRSSPADGVVVAPADLAWLIDLARAGGHTDE